jgi:hypothetical protein
LLSFSLVVLTTTHDWGYFSVIGSHFRAVLSAYDYITNALEWMPFYLLFLTGTWLASRALGVLNADDGSDNTDRKAWRRGQARSDVPVLITSTAMLGVGFFLTFPTNLTCFVPGLLGISIVLAGRYITWKDKDIHMKLEKRRLVAGGMGAVGVLVVAYLLGVLEAKTAIEGPTNVYKLTLKGERIKTAVLLRAFEKGILIWNIDSRTAELQRWDQVDGLSHIVAFDKMTPACRMISWFCPPHPEP